MTAYRDLLNRIYGETIVNGLLEKNIYKFKGRKELESFINSFRFTQKVYSSGCEKCVLYYNVLRPSKHSFETRNMDFPSWLGELKFDDKPARKIMILGESVTGGFEAEGALSKERKINMAFGLTLLFDEMDDCKDWASTPNPSALFWKRIITFFSSRTDNWLKDLYITDVAKCNTSGIASLLIPCGYNYIMEEISLIRPKLILIMGDKARDAILAAANINNILITKIEDIPNVEIKKNSKTGKSKIFNFHKNKRIVRGYFHINKDKIEFLSIPHTSKTSGYSTLDDYWDKLHAYLHLNFKEFF